MMDTFVCVDCGCVESNFDKLYIGLRGPAHKLWPDCLNAAIARAEAAEKRVAELEAAQAWRPVTEPPIDEGEYWAWDEHNGMFIAHYDPERDYDDDWAWSDYSGEMIPVDKWTPLMLPPPPSWE